MKYACSAAAVLMLAPIAARADSPRADPFIFPNSRLPSIYAPRHALVLSFGGAVELGEGGCIRGPFTITVAGQAIYTLAAGDEIGCSEEK
jgi:hypothetical protein